MGKHLVFVYGTLRRGGARPMLAGFPGSKFVADAQVRGRLFDLGAYPGLVLGDSDPPVTGEVYEVDEETLRELDDYEASSRYRRERAEVSLGGGRSACWTYEPDPEFYSLRTLIASGDWVEYAGTKRGPTPD